MGLEMLTTHLVLLGILLFLVVVLFVYNFRPRGKLVVMPGEGLVVVYTGFRPRSVKIKLCKPKPIPGCSQLEDSISVSELLPNGFVLAYKIESGARIIKWIARR